MSDFQPIPGVTYRVNVPGVSQCYPFSNWLFAPRNQADEWPWLDAYGERQKLPEDGEIVRIHFNPHPPTRTEWGVRSGNDLFGPMLRADAINDAAHYRKNWPQEPVALLRRQVTETEWVEVDEKETGQ